ncbi:MAG TPA: ABC transporter permease [Candidatus Binatia bacterium]|jgi:ABC-type nitrate/sulfonate/bicarbonate transport system permease component
MSSTGNAYETIAKPETPVTLVVSFLTGTRAKAFASLAGGLLLWEIVGRLTSPVIFVPFSVVALAFWNLTVSGELIHHTAVSFTELILGFVIGSMIGIVGGTLAAFSKNFRVATDVWISIAYSTPYVAFVPLFIVWFGIDMASKIALVIFSVFIPVWLNTYTGIISVDAQLVEVAQAFGATRSQVLRWIVLPWAFPSLIVGFRLAFSRGFIAVVVGELVGSTAGLGYLIDIAGNSFQTDKLLAGVAVLAIITVIFVEILKLAQRRLFPWWEIKGE